ncbi:right-handed parallel beta-helix repeat-containing protein [Vampirovibrio sp.]|uniref:right-handed parallel beta-helix repeat-containing protein n=1 Tax=Vampirovibrio sp. TaxID=2717857 RepID=UPI0035930754
MRFLSSLAKPLSSLALIMAFSLAPCADQVSWAVPGSPTQAYTINSQARTITIQPTADAAAQINKALTYLNQRADQGNVWTLKFQPGRYLLNQSIRLDRLQNVSLVSDRQNPAILRKDPAAFKNEYVFYTRFSKNVSISGFDIYGLSVEFKPELYATTTNPIWHDQGLYFGSCNGVLVNENRFFNFGNAALRITTTEMDPVAGVNSFNSTVTRNYFRNVYQVSTTSNDTIHGGTSAYYFMGNTFDELRGSLKFASRTSGATDVRVHFNHIRSGNTDGIEIVGYNNLELYKNKIENVPRHAINCYSNGRSVKGFQWGDNLRFISNEISNVNWGLRFSADAFGDGYHPSPNNIKIDKNLFSDIKGPSPAITLSNGTFKTPSITENQLNNIMSKKYISAENSISPKITNNMAEHKPL